MLKTFKLWQKKLAKHAMKFLQTCVATNVQLIQGNKNKKLNQIRTKLNT